MSEKTIRFMCICWSITIVCQFAAIVINLLK
jgi:hypothetical protein